MMIGRRSVSRPRADAAAELDARQARQHPVEQHEIGHLLAQADLGLVAARDAVDLVALGFEIVAQEQRQRLLVLDDQNARCPCRRSVSVSASTVGEARSVVLRPLDGERLAGDEVMDRLGDVGGVVADALDVLGAEQEMRAEARCCADPPSCRSGARGTARCRARRSRRRAARRRGPRFASCCA